MRILFRSVPHFLIEFFTLLVSSFLSSLYILDIRPLSYVDVGGLSVYVLPLLVDG